jgi:TetR/AcrR family transcriptional repressor of bet genes
MARREDPDVRRRQIAEAVLAIAAREGLDAATVRDVAAEAGVSAGMVQHHFRSRDDMLLFTCRYMVQRTGERIAGRVAQLPEPRQPRALLRQIFEEMLPLDEERRTGIRVWIAFLARAVVREELGDYMRETHQGTHAMITGMLRQAEAAGTLALGVDPEREAIALFSQVDGLVSHVLLDHYTGDEALRTIDDHLDRVFRR